MDFNGGVRNPHGPPRDEEKSYQMGPIASSSDSSPAESFNEKTLVAPTPNYASAAGSGANTPYGYRSQNASRRASIAGSVRSNRSIQSAMMDDIKHEVMVNYLFQQQCSALWVGDGSGLVEGVVLRKSRGNYLACPPQLAESPFAEACSALNIQVRVIVILEVVILIFISRLQ
jgi:hypothetical protein